MTWLLRDMPDDLEDDDEDEDEDEDWPVRCRELRRVLIGPAEEVGGTRVLTLELYDDGIVVRWTSLEEDEAELALSDDAGTVYEFESGGSSGGGGRFRGESAFTPAVPEGASMLRLALAGRDFELGLDR